MRNEEKDLVKEIKRNGEWNGKREGEKRKTE